MKQTWGKDLPSPSFLSFCVGLGGWNGRDQGSSEVAGEKKHIPREQRQVLLAESKLCSEPLLDSPSLIYSPHS